MKKFRWNFGNTRKATSLFFIAAATGMVVLTSAFYFMNSYQEQRQTINSKAATTPSGQCNVNPADKCSQGIFSREVCQFIRNGAGKTAWNNFTLSGSPNIRPDNYGNSGGEDSIIKIDSSNGQPFSGGVYYTFNTTPGKTYCASWRWGPNTNTDGVTNAFSRTIGLDPTGNTNASAGSVQWGNTESRVGRHLDYDLYADPNDLNIDKKITATGNTMTIFLKADYNASENSHLQIDMVNVYDEGNTSVPVATATPVPPANPVDSITCPTTSTQTYASRTISTAESVGDRTPADIHPDKNLAMRGYLQNDNNPMQLVNNNDPNPDALAPQLTSVTDNRTPPLYHLYQVYDWNWGTAPNWGSKGAPLINPWPVTAAGLFGSAGDNVYVPNSGYNVGGGYQAYVIYASANSLTLKYGAEDTASTGYVIHLDNFCVDPNLLQKYKDLSPPNKTNRNELPVLNGKQNVGKFKTKELIVAVRDTGEFMDPRSIAWWQGVSTLPPVPTGVQQCPIPPDTTGMQAVRNGENITIAWNPNPGATKYSVWVDNKRDPFDGSCASAAGDFCFDTAASSHTFRANPNDAYDWSIHAINACGQVKAQYGTYISANLNAPTPTVTPTLPPSCPAITQPGGLTWSCVRSFTSSVTLTWNPVTNATSYALELDNLSDPWDGSCTSPGGDNCLDLAGTSYTFTVNPASTYAWRIRSKNSCTVSSQNTGPTTRCGPVGPTAILTPTLIPPTGSPTAVPTNMQPPTNTPSPTPTPTATPLPAPRFTDCNKCGYCTNKTKQPGNLKECMACLYPGMTEQDTLRVDPIKNQPPAPRTGTYFSQLGCIDVGIAGFKDPGAAGGVLNIILNRLLFPITGVLALLSLIYGAFLLITGQDDPEQISRGKNWIYGGIIGVIFTFSSILIIRLVASDILKIPGFDF